MTLDWTISVGNVLTAAGGLAGMAAFFFKLHQCMERRITSVEKRIGGTEGDPPLSEQIALIEQATELRHQENDRRLQAIQDSVLQLMPERRLR